MSTPSTFNNLHSLSEGGGWGLSNCRPARFQVLAHTCIFKQSVKTVWMMISWLLRSQLIRIYIVFKTGFIHMSDTMGKPAKWDLPTTKHRSACASPQSDQHLFICCLDSRIPTDAKTRISS